MKRRRPGDRANAGGAGRPSDGGESSPELTSSSRPGADRPFLTPDRRYLIVQGRLWRAANPSLKPRERQRLTGELMTARRAVRDAMQRGDEPALKRARRAVNDLKVALGERGPVWWRDGAEDLNRHLVANTPYARWYAGALERAAHRRPPPRRARGGRER